MARHQMYYNSSAKKNIAASLKVHRKGKFAASLANRRKAIKCAMTEDETDELLEHLEEAMSGLSMASGELMDAADLKSPYASRIRKISGLVENADSSLDDLIDELQSDSETDIKASLTRRGTPIRCSMTEEEADSIYDYLDEALRDATNLVEHLDDIASEKGPHKAALTALLRESKSILSRINKIHRDTEKYIS